MEQKGSGEFPAEHHAFYLKFEKWRKEMLAANQYPNGVYRLLSPKKKINRLIGTDEEGIMYIGKGDILSSSTRVGKFVNALKNTEQEHHGGSRYFTNLIKAQYPIEDLMIHIRLVKDPEGQEKKELKAYLDTFGELPPFNRAMAGG